MPTGLSSETIHASCVAIDGRGVLIEGRSGAGKSDLTLRLIDRGAALVSDDYTTLRQESGALIARAPDALAGKIEVRGIGILDLPHVSDIPVALLVAIADQPPRMPERGQRRRVAGVDLPAVALAALEPSASIKVELALANLEVVG
ncbi:HPr kinase/phosphorylase [Sphingomonas floccifaciens]|uniref:HPr kinase/phosphorylase n=1 Tax=Sphingomonas floccifaciens TaxID=1844115 RepID=A0ABW4NF94_9SPHN